MIGVGAGLHLGLPPLDSLDHVVPGNLLSLRLQLHLDRLARVKAHAAKVRDIDGVAADDVILILVVAVDVFFVSDDIGLTLSINLIFFGLLQLVF